MRALWVAGIYHPDAGGIPVYVDRLTSGLAAVCEVGLVTEPRHQRPSDPRLAHFAVASLTRPSSPAEWQRAAAGLAGVVDAFAPDVVHFASAGETIYGAGLPPHVAVVATVYGNDLTAPWQSTPGRAQAEAIVDGLNACDHVFAISGYTARLVRGRGVTSPVTVVTAGCDLELFRPLPRTEVETRLRHGLPLDVPVVLTVGRLAPRKGHAWVLAALASAAIRAHWIVVGRGPMRDELAAEIASRGLADSVSLVEAVSKRELSLLYNACDVFVMTPAVREVRDLVDSEGFGLVYLEAAACGKPVIASDSAGCREAVVDGSTGLLVPAGDVSALVAAIDRLLDDPELRRSFGRAGRALVAGAGGWLRLAKEVRAVYERVTAYDVEAPPAAVMAPV